MYMVHNRRGFSSHITKSRQWRGYTHLTQPAVNNVGFIDGYSCSNINSKGAYEVRDITEIGLHMTHKNKGYVWVYAGQHPFKNKRNCVTEHRLIMEHHINRYLSKNEVVHHINHIRSDNRIENLQVMTIAEHDKLHGHERAGKKRIGFVAWNRGKKTSAITKRDLDNPPRDIG